MTEALIDIGSIISIIQISEEIIKHAHNCFHTVCEAKNDIWAIINVFSGFRKTLQQLYSSVKFSESLQAHGTFQRYEDKKLSTSLGIDVQMNPNGNKPITSRLR